ncbi:hypothetical protein H206_05419 [Candidatus Electrothrix aarhusensis]|uniref:Uncharacterized protein n=1 Tax=Candidatus Electrothrix aarhusensis TaxID=1859131 RepID=A0A3S3SQT7_9BACT|nr:hypothetical protein H206_05419 [Candidatus Electrothrix aarhusensis]
MYRTVFFTAIASMGKMYTVLFLQSRKNFHINMLKKEIIILPNAPENSPTTRQ